METLENMAETGKHNLRFAETGKVLLKAAEKPEKTMKSCGNRKMRKKPRKARKGTYFLWKPGNRSPITRPPKSKARLARGESRIKQV